MAKPKLYTSQAWLERQVYRNKKTPETIAKEQGVAVQTIYNWCNKFRIKT